MILFDSSNSASIFPAFPGLSYYCDSRHIPLLNIAESVWLYQKFPFTSQIDLSLRTLNMATPAALLVGPLFFQNSKWKSLPPEVKLKVNHNLSIMSHSYIELLTSIAGAENWNSR